MDEKKSTVSMGVAKTIIAHIAEWIIVIFLFSALLVVGSLQARLMIETNSILRENQKKIEKLQDEINDR